MFLGKPHPSACLKDNWSEQPEVGQGQRKAVFGCTSTLVCRRDVEAHGEVGHRRIVTKEVEVFAKDPCLGEG